MKLLVVFSILRLIVIIEPLKYVWLLIAAAELGTWTSSLGSLLLLLIVHCQLAFVDKLAVDDELLGTW